MKQMKTGSSSEYDTGILPPGDDVGGAALPNKGQSLNRGYGASQAEMERGHSTAPQPDMYESPKPQRDFYADEGFVRRPTGSVERN